MFAVRSLTSLATRNGPALACKLHTLPDLPYDYAALEPAISRDIMTLHHTKHHKAYVDNLNAAEEKLAKALKDNDVAGAIGVTQGLRFNGGGHINHSIFWKNLTPDTTSPSSLLGCAIQNEFKSLEELKKQLIAASLGVQGSGWAWLGLNPKDKRLVIATTPNQDPLQAVTGNIPLLGIDVWEHAYYLQYKNVRASYVEAIFDVVNWNDVSKRYEAASGK